jgi:hypothetical protein
MMVLGNNATINDNVRQQTKGGQPSGTTNKAKDELSKSTGASVTEAATLYHEQQLVVKSLGKKKVLHKTLAKIIKIIESTNNLAKGSVK